MHCDATQWDALGCSTTSCIKWEFICFILHPVNLIYYVYNSCLCNKSFLNWKIIAREYCPKSSLESEIKCTSLYSQDIVVPSWCSKVEPCRLQGDCTKILKYFRAIIASWLLIASVEKRAQEFYHLMWTSCRVYRFDAIVVYTTYCAYIMMYAI